MFGAGISDKICPYKSKLVDEIVQKLKEKEFAEAVKAAMEKALTGMAATGKHSAHDKPRSQMRSEVRRRAVACAES